MLSRSTTGRDCTSLCLEGPPWINDNRRSLCTKAHHTFRHWRSNLWLDERQYPRTRLTWRYLSLLQALKETSRHRVLSTAEILHG